MKRKQLEARPVGHNYRIELEQRFGARAHLCEMAALGVSSQDRKPYEVAEGVAIISIAGVLTNDAWWWDETEYSEIQAEVRMAADDPDVKAILLRIKSPGGSTDNSFETAAVLREVGQKKKMWAVADNMAYSAAYLLACTTAKIYVPPMTGGVGSVGVFSAHVDYSGAMEKAGIKVTFTSAGKGKTDGNPYEPLSESAQKKIKAEVDRLYELFVAAVATGRNKTSDAIKKLGAECFTGAEASLGAGYADAIGTVEQAWFDLANAVQSESAKTFSMAASAMTSHKEVPKMEGTTEVTKPADAGAAAANATVDTEALAAAARAEGFADAEAIVDLCAIAGKPEMAGDFIKKRTSSADVRKQLLATKAASDGGEIRSQILPETGTKAVADQFNNGLIKACEAIGAQMKGAK